MRPDKSTAAMEQKCSPKPEGCHAFTNLPLSKEQKPHTISVEGLKGPLRYKEYTVRAASLLQRGLTSFDLQEN